MMNRTSKSNRRSYQRSEENPSWKIHVRFLWIISFGLFLFVGSLFVLATAEFFGEMPTFEILENPNTEIATEIISEEGITLGKMYINDNRTFVSYDELSQNLVQALIATEDERFYKHSGIDFIGTLRAFLFLGSKGGGSTITQQLARQLFVGVRSRNRIEAGLQKVKEWVISVRLERNYTKEEIITMYFNIYDFGNHADGIISAAKIYFNKLPMELSIEESAMLVGMFKNSSLYNPIRRPKKVKARRNVTLYQMYNKGDISEKMKDSLQQLPLKLNFTPESHDVGVATYFREHIRRKLKEWVKDNPKPDGTKYNLYKDGLKIYTTINYKLQKHAEQAVKEHMKNVQKEFFRQNKTQKNTLSPFVSISKDEVDEIINRTIRNSERWRHLKYDLNRSEDEIWKSFDKPIQMKVFSWDGERDTIMTPRDSIFYYKHFLRAGMVSIEPQTGFVKTWVGGVNYRYFKYDQVIQGARQIGSTFKPFVYATAIDQLHYSPCDKFPDIQYCIEAGKYGNNRLWCPRNSSGTYTGDQKTLKAALANSINSVTAMLIDRVGPKPVINLTKKLGITSNIPSVPSIALGTPDIKLFEMVGAYSTFANKGIHIKPVFIKRIEDKTGTTIYSYKPELHDVVSHQIAYTVLSLLKGVTEYGSGRRLRGDDQRSKEVYRRMITGYPYNFKNPIAGKTGTTQNNSDGWFLGIVPNLVTGVWVGGEDRATHFISTKYGQGASMALPIWALFMKKNYAEVALNISKEDFEAPEEQTIKIDCYNLTPLENKEDEGFVDFDF